MQTTCQCVEFLRMKINKDLFSALKFDILQISCVLKIRLGDERSEHAIGLLTDGPPSPILTNKKVSYLLSMTSLIQSARVLLLATTNVLPNLRCPW